MRPHCRDLLLFFYLVVFDLIRVVHLDLANGLEVAKELQFRRRRRILIRSAPAI